MFPCTAENEPCKVCRIRFAALAHPPSAPLPGGDGQVHLAHAGPGDRADAGRAQEGRELCFF